MKRITKLTGEIENLYNDTKARSIVLLDRHDIFPNLGIPKIDLTEFGFLKIILWLHKLYSGLKVSLDFLITDISIKNHISVVMRLREKLMYQLNYGQEKLDSDQSVVLWFTQYCSTSNPNESQWKECIYGILQEAFSFFQHINYRIHFIEKHEFKETFTRDWKTRIERAVIDIECIIMAAAHDLGRNHLDSAKFRDQYASLWANYMSSTDPDSEKNIRRLVEQMLINEGFGFLPITARDIIDKLSIPPGRRVEILLREAFKIYNHEKCSKEELLSRLMKYRETEDSGVRLDVMSGDKYVEEIGVRLTDLTEEEKSISFLIITATPTETRAVKNKIRPFSSRTNVLKVSTETQVFRLGLFGVYKAVHVQCDMGLGGRDSSILATYDAIKAWKPKAVIMVGIAFGRDSSKQNIGDVLVSDSIVHYEPARVGNVLIPRGIIPQSGLVLSNRFKNKIDWDFKLFTGKMSKIRIGQLLSGEKLVDDYEYKEKLFKQFPNAIGGEMEGAGVCAACLRADINEWIIVKGICDWGDGQKVDFYQGAAAEAAATLCLEILSEEEAFEKFK